MIYGCRKSEKIWNASRICVSSLRRGHANLLCIVPILVYVSPLSEHVYSVVSVRYIFVLTSASSYCGMASFTLNYLHKERMRTNLVK